MNIRSEAILILQIFLMLTWFMDIESIFNKSNIIRVTLMLVILIYFKKELSGCCPLGTSFTSISKYQGGRKIRKHSYIVDILTECSTPPPQGINN